MNRLNITEYQSEPGEYQMFYGKASLREGYYILNFDERFHHMIGVKGYLSIPELIHPEDAAAFEEALTKLEEGPQHLILRIMCYNDKYRFFYVVVRYNGKVLDGFRSVDLEVTQIMTITDRYLQYVGLVEKYREFMGLFPGCYMEYEYGTGLLKLYEYRGQRSTMLYEDSLEDTLVRVEADRELNSEQKAEFRILYENLKSARDHVKVELDAVTLDKQATGVRYEIAIAMIYRDDSRERAIGLVNVIGAKKEKESYYLSDSAFDPGTGLLNKRAINEYAIEKIQNRTQGLYLVIMDIDDFKKVNDNYGHMFGDQVLSKAAEIIKGVVKTRGAVGRFGGDEFMIVLEGIDSEATLRRILSTISRNIEWAFKDVEGLKVTASIGVSKYLDDGITYDELFQKADKCVYIAKGKGKNRYIIYDVKKHGEVVKEDSNQADIAFHATVSDDDKNKAVSEMTLKLFKEGTGALLPVMEQMRSFFDIDGIAIYTGTDLRRTYETGNYVNPIQSFDFAKDPHYQKLFDRQGFCEVSNLQQLEKMAPQALELYNKQENGKIIQCQVMRGEEPVAIVSFDFFNRFPKQGTINIGLIRVMGRLMAEVACGAH
ncbi:MAG: GGDEF domain-containing protein [Candidatus Gastranaerophilales bacterium]|nr:GGDEF domain-containing protein [Candidatus Gastranaerophilales bacterium]